MPSGKQRKANLSNKRRASRGGQASAWASMLIGLVVCTYWLASFKPDLFPGLPLWRSASSRGAVFTCCCGEFLLPILGLVWGRSALNEESYTYWLAWTGIILCLAA